MHPIRGVEAHQHAVAARKITVHAYTGERDLDGSQLRRERADGDGERLRRTEGMLHVEVETVRRPPAKEQLALLLRVGVVRHRRRVRVDQLKVPHGREARPSCVAHIHHDETRGLSWDHDDAIDAKLKLILHAESAPKKSRQKPWSRGLYSGARLLRFIAFLRTRMALGRFASRFTA